MNKNTKKAMEEFVIGVCGMAGILSTLIPEGGESAKYLSQIPIKASNLLTALETDETIVEVN